MKDGNLDYIASLILESYKENHTDKSYLAGKEERLMQNENKLDSLFYLFELDERNKRSFCKRLGIEFEELAPFMKVLQKV